MQVFLPQENTSRNNENKYVEDQLTEKKWFLCFLETEVSPLAPFPVPQGHHFQGNTTLPRFQTGSARLRCKPPELGLWEMLAKGLTHDTPRSGREFSASSTYPMYLITPIKKKQPKPKKQWFIYEADSNKHISLQKKMSYAEESTIQYVLCQLKNHNTEKTSRQKKITDQELSRGLCNVQELCLTELTTFTFSKEGKRRSKYTGNNNHTVA